MQIYTLVLAGPGESLRQSQSLLLKSAVAPVELFFVCLFFGFFSVLKGKSDDASAVWKDDPDYNQCGFIITGSNAECVCGGLSDPLTV